MFSVNNLIINCVELQHSHYYIADVFWHNNIAQVSKVTLIPYLKNGKVFNIAYITIGQLKYSILHTLQLGNGPNYPIILFSV